MTNPTKRDKSSSNNKLTKKENIIVPNNPDNEGDVIQASVKVVEQPEIKVSKKKKNKKRKKGDTDENKLSKLEIRRERGLIPKRLSEKLRLIRLHLNLTQANMLVAVHPHESIDNRARVSQYERGERIPTLIELWNYAKLVHIPMETLIDDSADLPFN